MFAGANDSQQRAETVSNWLANHQSFKSHSRHLPREKLIEKSMAVGLLESDQALQDKSLSTFHATMHTMAHTGAVKVVENHMGQAFIKSASPLVPMNAPLYPLRKV